MRRSGEAWPGVSSVRHSRRVKSDAGVQRDPADPAVGLLLPCNVTVEWLAEGRTGLRLTHPEALLARWCFRALPTVVGWSDARERMVRVADAREA